nr:hypothetical protein [Tanacetum cinerariifolium]
LWLINANDPVSQTLSETESNTVANINPSLEPVKDESSGKGGCVP